MDSSPKRSILERRQGEGRRMTRDRRREDIPSTAERRSGVDRRSGWSRRSGETRRVSQRS
jgi:hypothetical protein